MKIIYLFIHLVELLQCLHSGADWSWRADPLSSSILHSNSGRVDFPIVGSSARRYFLYDSSSGSLLMVT
uniref:Secreted protein n=1 Tax=Physcomitrium patens TaxID=3218 RepID=A0A2K1JU25_PHYPA|nr:hypothetical protein PHYPA_014803 [Physcomitrium patens]